MKCHEEPVEVSGFKSQGSTRSPARSVHSAQAARRSYKMLFLLLVYLLLSVSARDVQAEEVDCQVYNHLYVCLSSGGLLQSVSFEDVNAVQTIEDIELHLEGLGIEKIAKDAFLEVTNSSALYLRDNKLSTISRHYFPALDQLTYLDLKNNSIVNIEDGAFAKLSSLETLLLDYNNISAFRPGVWKGLADLHELYATNNNVELKRNVFRGLRHLETLALDSNDISEIPIGAFNGLPHLDLLYLSRNRISSLHPEVFRGLPEINELDLGRNQLKSILAGTFKYLKNLNSLWLNGNQILTLEADTFEGLDNLLLLFLNSNELRFVDLSAFAKMRNVMIDPGFEVRGSLAGNFSKTHNRLRCMFRGYRQEDTPLPHPCYRSTSMDYGWYAPTIHTVPQSYYPRSGSFSLELGRAGMYRNRSLNTELDKTLF